MMIKPLVVFSFVLLLASFISAASETKTVTKTESGSLFQPLNDPNSAYIKVTPGFQFNYQSTLTSPKVLSYGAGGGLDGATICTGNVGLSSTISGDWAAPNFYAYDTYWNSCNPPGSNAAPTYNDISWNMGNYNAIKDWNNCYETDPQCWGYEGPFVSHKVDTYDYFGTLYKQRAGSIAATCIGTSTVSVSGGTFPNEGSLDTITGTTFNRGSFNLGTGTYTFTDSFDMKGCAVTVRQPKCNAIPQAEDVFSRTVAQLAPGAPEYTPSVGTNTFTVTVTNRQNSMTCGPSNPASPIDVPSGSGVILNVTVRNNGNVANRVTNVISTNSNVVAIPFDMALCGITVPSTTPPCNLPNNGFNQNIDKGRSGHVWVWVTAPNCGSTLTSYQTTLRFAFGTSATVCNTQTAYCNLGVRVNGCSDENSSVDRCEITPASTTIGFKQSERFSLQCFNNNSVVACGPSVVWTLQNLLGVFWDQSPTGAFVGVHSPVGSTGTLNATIGAVSCISNITVGNSTAAIDVKPDTAQLEVNDTQHFNTTCYDAGGLQIPCSQVRWDPNTVLTNGDLSSSSDTGTNYTARQNGTDELWARADGLPGSPYDWSLITIGSGTPPCVGPSCPCTGPSCDHDGKSDSCEIRPGNFVVLTGLSFTALCHDPRELCGVAYWYLDGVPWGSVGYASPDLLFTGGNHTVAVYVDNLPTKSCVLDFGVSSYQCIQYS